MALILLAYQESILEQNWYQQYLLEKVKNNQIIEEQYSDYLKYLREVSQQLNDSRDEKITVEIHRIGIEIKFVEDISEMYNLGTFREYVFLQTIISKLSADQLKFEITNVEKQMERAHNEADKVIVL